MLHRSRLVVIAVALAATAQETAERYLLAPPANAVFHSGPVTLIARGEGQPAVTLDGKPVTLETLADGAFTAKLHASPGAHEVALGSEKIRFFIGGERPPDFLPFRPHPPTANCTTCHAVKNGVWAFQRASLVTLCGQCHDREKFPAKHTHPAGMLADCQLCHDPHGSTAASHLRLSKEKACKQCHN